MKRFQILLAAPLALALFLTACSDPVKEVVASTALQAKLINNSTTYYAQIPDNPRYVYASQVIEYADGSAQITRSVVPYNGNQNYVHVALSHNVSIAHNGQSTEIDFSAGDGWFVPFDPGVQPIQVGGRVVAIDCECDNGASGCNVDILIDPNTNKADIGCLGNQHCTGNCRATLTIVQDFLTADNGILINATEISTP